MFALLFIVIDFAFKSTGNISLPQYKLDLIIYKKSSLMLKSIFSTKKSVFRHNNKIKKHRSL